MVVVRDVGLTVLADPEDPEIDLVFVHGLQGHPQKTWTLHLDSTDHDQYKTGFTSLSRRLRMSRAKRNSFPKAAGLHQNQGIFWPKDLLASDVPKARIMTFGYNSTVLELSRVANQNNIFAHAKDLMYALESHRRKDRNRSLVLVAHSLGGILVKEMLRRSEVDMDDKINCLFASTVGVFFFGTPHRGSKDWATFGEGVSRIASALLQRNANSQNLHALLPTGPELELCRESFMTQWLRRGDSLVVRTFQESKALTGVRFGRLDSLIVPPDSSSLDHPNQRARTIDEDHIRMVKCHEAYEMVRDDVQELLEKVEASSETNLTAVHDTTQTMIPEDTVVPANCSVQSVEAVEATWGLDQSCLDGRNGPKKSLEHSSLPSVTEMHDVHTFSAVNVEDYKADLPKPVRGTCTWIDQNVHYVSWSSSVQPALLWIIGNAGCGKTILSSYLIDQLSNATRDRSAPLTCFYFCDGRIDNNNDAKSILRSLIQQILQRRRWLVKHLTNAIYWHGPNLISSFQLLWRLLLAISNDPEAGQIYIVVDAIDECEEQTGRRFLNAVIAFMRETTSNNDDRLNSVKFVLTSRPALIHDYSLDSAKVNVLALYENQSRIRDDIQLVVRQGLCDITQKIHCGPDIEDLLQTVLLSKADQTFLWVDLVLARLQRTLVASRSEVHKILSDLPQDLRNTYRKFLATIPSEYRSNAQRLLRLLVGGSRHLSLTEIDVAFTITAKHTSVKEVTEDRHLNVKRFLEGTLGPLIKITDSRVSLLHQSIKQFLLDPLLAEESDPQVSSYATDSARAALVLAESCISYLNLDEIWSRKSLSDRDSLERSSGRSLTLSRPSSSVVEDDHDPYYLEGDAIFWEQSDFDRELRETSVSRFDFFSYSAVYWAEHLKACESLASAQVLKAVRHLTDPSSGRLDKWLTVFWLEKGMEGQCPDYFDALLVAAFFDLPKILSSLLEETGPFNQRKKDLALFWAARMGSGATVNILLHNQANPNTAMPDRQSPLTVAAEYGHSTVVERLLAEDAIDINIKGRYNRSALSFAASQGHFEIVEAILRSRKTDIEDQDHRKWSPLVWAVCGGHTNIVRRLLDGPVTIDVNQKDIQGRTAISWAAGEGLVQPLKYLLSLRSADPNIGDNNGKSPLSWACGNGRSDAVRLLIRSGRVELSCKDQDGRNAVSWACSSGSEATLRAVLRDKLAVVDEADGAGWDPLAWALDRNSPGLIQALLTTGSVQIDRRDGGGRTPLVWAASYGYTDVVALLLSQGANAGVAGNDGRTALDLAVDYEHEEVVRILKAHEQR